MLKLRKIPLEPLIQILQDLWDGGADYMDLSGEQNDNGDTPKDIIQITVKPEYIIDNEESDEAQDVELDFTEDNSPIVEKKSLSEDDLNDLI